MSIENQLKKVIPNDMEIKCINLDVEPNENEEVVDDDVDEFYDDFTKNDSN